MKKKFLSLMMAAAVVATTSVSAFASTQTIESKDDKDGRANVTITGKVEDNKGNMPTANFKVTVPTTASFTVNKSAVVGPQLEVKNEGSQEIEVYAQSFTRLGSGGISLVSAKKIAEDTSKELTRAHVALRLEGQDGKEAYLGETKTGNGIYEDADLERIPTNKVDGVKLLTLSAGDVDEQKDNIVIKGSAGSKSVESAISDEFQLTLKIKKVTKGTASAGSAEGVQGVGGAGNTDHS